MTEKKKLTVDPFPNLPRPGLFVEMPRKVIWQSPTGIVEMGEVNDPTSFEPVVKPSIEKAKEAIAEIELGKRGRGRPKSSGAKPWEVAGISKAQWYRRQKGK